MVHRKCGAMIYRLCGCVMLIIASGGIGYTMVHRSQRNIEMVRQLSNLIERIACSLRYHQYPLSQLLRNEQGSLTGDLLMIIQRFATELESQVSPNVACCMDVSLDGCAHVSGDIQRIFHVA